MGCDDCRFRALGDGLGFEWALCGGEGGLDRAAARAAVGSSCCAEGIPFSLDFGESKGFIGMLSFLFESLLWNGFSSWSFGLRDSVEPLFLTDRAVGGRSSVRRASSICR